MNFKFVLVAFFLTTAICCGCNASETNNDKNMEPAEKGQQGGYSKVPFDSAILAIDKKLADFTNYEELFAVPEFISIYEQGMLYREDVVRLLSDTTFTKRQKKISICTMQRLDVDSYLRFCSECKELFRTGKIPEEILMWAISPNFSKRHILARNYSEKGVKSLLEDLKLDSSISAVYKKIIENILSGKTLESLKEQEEGN